MFYQRTIRRETLAGQFSKGKVRRWIVELDPVGATMRFRLKGERRWYGPITVGYLATHTMLKMLALERANKAKERKQKRHTRRGSK